MALYVWKRKNEKRQTTNHLDGAPWLCRTRRRLNHDEEFLLLIVERFLEEEVSVGTFYSIFFLRFDISQGPGMLFSYHAHCPAKATLKQKHPPWKHTFHSLRCKSMKLCRIVVGAPSRWKKGLHFYHIPAEVKSKLIIVVEDTQWKVILLWSSLLADVLPLTGQQ